MITLVDFRVTYKNGSSSILTQTMMEVWIIEIIQKLYGLDVGIEKIKQRVLSDWIASSAVCVCCRRDECWE